MELELRNNITNGLEGLIANASAALRLVVTANQTEALDAVKGVTAIAASLHRLFPVTDGGRFQSPDLAEGYQTVIGYYDETNPEYLLAVKNLITSFEKDERVLTKLCEERRVRVLQALPPPYLRDTNLIGLASFPRDILREHFE